MDAVDVKSGLYCLQCRHDKDGLGAGDVFGAADKHVDETICAVDDNVRESKCRHDKTFGVVFKCDVGTDFKESGFGGGNSCRVLTCGDKVFIYHDVAGSFVGTVIAERCEHTSLNLCSGWRCVAGVKCKVEIYGNAKQGNH